MWQSRDILEVSVIPLFQANPPWEPSRAGREDQLTLAAPVWYNRIWLLAEPLCNTEGEEEV